MAVALDDVSRTEMKRAIRAWTAPKPAQGQCVLYYHRCVHSNPEIAFVKSVSDRLIGVVMRGSGYATVYHVDDPRLKYQPELKNDIDGMWEFNKHDLELIERLEALESKVEKLLTAKLEITGPPVKRRTAKKATTVSTDES